jgi:hypothetical protein
MLLRGGANPSLVDKYGNPPPYNIDTTITDTDFAIRSNSGLSCPTHRGSSCSKDVGYYRQMIFNLLRRWEDYCKDTGCGKSSEETDEDWVAFSIGVIKDLGGKYMETTT